jgi:hypothetical protein
LTYKKLQNKREGDMSSDDALLLREPYSDATFYGTQVSFTALCRLWELWCKHDARSDFGLEELDALSRKLQAYAPSLRFICFFEDGAQDEEDFQYYLANSSYLFTFQSIASFDFTLFQSDYAVATRLIMQNCYDGEEGDHPFSETQHLIDSHKRRKTKALESQSSVIPLLPTTHNNSRPRLWLGTSALELGVPAPRPFMS